MSENMFRDLVAKSLCYDAGVKGMHVKRFSKDEVNTVRNKLVAIGVGRCSHM